jgi:glycolate oxidase iron-sulfur subunit
LTAGATVAALGQRLRLVPARVPLPPLALRSRPLEVREPHGARGSVWLLRGCVMDVVQREVHQAACDLLALAGYRVRLADPHEGCCGALSHHAGLDDLAHAQASKVMASMPGDDLVVVDAAGCGAQLRELGDQLGTSAARAFSDRVVDVCELLARVVDELPPPRRPAGPVAVQDPCHLRHVQRVHGSVRTLLGPHAEVRELDDDGLCCGAGGAFAMLRPDDAAAIRDRKLAAIARSGAPLVASANPGCDLHLSAAGVEVRHPVVIVADAIRGGATRGRRALAGSGDGR